MQSKSGVQKASFKQITVSTDDLTLKTALDLIPNGVCIWDADDTLVLSNAAFAELHYSKPEDFRAGMQRIEALTRLIGPRQSLMRPQSDAEKQTDVQRMHDGRWLQINTQCTADGSLVTFVADITDLKEHEFELTAKKNELMTRVYDLDRARGNLEKQKAELAALSDNLFVEKARAIEANEAKSQFLANMSHDLRTPLNHIIGYAETMAMRQLGDLSNESYTDYPEIIHTAGLQLLSQVNDIIDVYKIEKGEMNIVKIHTTFENILDETLPAIFSHIEKKSQVFIPDIEANVVLNVDPRAMRLMLQNLLTNASKFTADYGKIYLTGKSDGDNFKIIVKDTGIGIEPEMLAKLCKPFVQCENAYVRSYQGSGLGLFIAKSLTQKHGGDLKISSIVGEGTTIVVNVPLITG
jgi:two-component system, cell cycle sensor histidine kinase PleC